MKSTMILEPFQSDTCTEDIAIHSQNYKDIATLLNNNKDDIDNMYDEFLHTLDMTEQDYIQAIRS